MRLVVLEYTSMYVVRGRAAIPPCVVAVVVTYRYHLRSTQYHHASNEGVRRTLGLQLSAPVAAGPVGDVWVACTTMVAETAMP